VTSITVCFWRDDLQRRTQSKKKLLLAGEWLQMPREFVNQIGKIIHRQHMTTIAFFSFDVDYGRKQTTTMGCD